MEYGWHKHFSIDPSDELRIDLSLRFYRNASIPVTDACVSFYACGNEKQMPLHYYFIVSFKGENSLGGVCSTVCGTKDGFIVDNEALYRAPAVLAIKMQYVELKDTHLAE